jgi:hypothetical protein
MENIFGTIFKKFVCFFSFRNVAETDSQNPVLEDLAVPLRVRQLVRGRHGGGAFFVAKGAAKLGPVNLEITSDIC